MQDKAKEPENQSSTPLKICPTAPRTSTRMNLIGGLCADARRQSTSPTAPHRGRHGMPESDVDARQVHVQNMGLARADEGKFES